MTTTPLNDDALEKLINGHAYEIYITHELSDEEQDVQQLELFNIYMKAFKAHIQEAVVAELNQLIENTKCLRPECRTEHKIKRSDVDKRIAELKLSIK